MHVDDLQFVGPKEGVAVAEAFQRAPTMDVQGPFSEPGDTSEKIEFFWQKKKLKAPIHPGICKHDKWKGLLRRSQYLAQTISNSGLCSAVESQSTWFNMAGNGWWL